MVCGNLLNGASDPIPNSYASGADGTLIRTTIQHSVTKGWGMGILDVRTAFLLAPRPQPTESQQRSDSDPTKSDG